VPLESAISNIKFAYELAADAIGRREMTLIIAHDKQFGFDCFSKTRGG